MATTQIPSVLTTSSLAVETTALITSVVTESAQATGASNAPITVVVSSVYNPSSTANSGSFSTSRASTSLQILTLSVLPLTTIFTPPASCSTRPFTLSALKNVSVGTWGMSGSIDPCYPPNWATAKTNYYTPGACPEGHTYAGIFLGQSLSASYTSVNCCPSGMDLFLSGTTQCSTLITTPTYVLLPNLETSTISSFPFTGFATPVRVVWSPDDLSMFTPSAAPAIAVTKQEGIADATTTPSPELSVGAKAGIGVGVTIGGVLLIGVIVFAVFRTRKRKAARVASTSSDDVDTKPELSGDSSVVRKTMAELDDQAESREMEGDAMFPELAHLIKSSELEVPHKVHELPA